jgi:glycerol kinase
MPLLRITRTGSSIFFEEDTDKLDSFIITIDQGSSSTKVLAFDHQAQLAYRSSRPLKIERFQSTHVEQDPLHVLEETRKALDEILSEVYTGGHDVSAIGLACQRSSFLFWNRSNGKPYTPIISWQDLRAKHLCDPLSSHRNEIYQKTGLPLTGHYGGPKFLWLLQNNPETQGWIKNKATVFSPWNSFLLWHLTDEKVCATDESVAGRTLLFNIHEKNWDQELLDLFQVPRTILPEVFPTCHLYGHYHFKGRSIPILCSIGDHQGALLGLGGVEKGQCGINYGTSAGVLVNIGSTPSIVNGLLTNIGYSDPGVTIYAAEGTVNAAGSLFEWFEKEKGIPNASKNWEELIASSSDGWYMIPGMYGIAAPYWKETVSTEFVGEGNHPSPGIQLRAGMESIAFLIADILDRLRSLPDFGVKQIMAAGGAARSPLLQFQADLLGIPVHHSSISDATALGCAFLTGLYQGFWKDKGAVHTFIRKDETFNPGIIPAERESFLKRWHDILKACGVIS